MFPVFVDVGYGKRSALANSAVCPEFFNSEMVQLTFPGHASFVISVAWSARCFPESAVCYISQVVAQWLIPFRTCSSIAQAETA